MSVSRIETLSVDNGPKFSVIREEKTISNEIFASPQNAQVIYEEDSVSIREKMKIEQLKHSLALFGGFIGGVGIAALSRSDLSLYSDKTYIGATLLVTGAYLAKKGFDSVDRYFDLKKIYMDTQEKLNHIKEWVKSQEIVRVEKPKTERKRRSARTVNKEPQETKDSEPAPQIEVQPQPQAVELEVKEPEKVLTKEPKANDDEASSDKSQSEKKDGLLKEVLVDRPARVIKEKLKEVREGMKDKEAESEPSQELIKEEKLVKEDEIEVLSFKEYEWRNKQIKKHRRELKMLEKQGLIEKHDCTGYFCKTCSENDVIFL